MIGNETPQFLAERRAARAAAGVAREAPVFDDTRRRGVVAAVIEPAVKGVQHPVVGPDVGHPSPIAILGVKGLVAGIAVDEVIPFFRRADDRGCGVNRIAQLPHLHGGCHALGDR